MIRGLALMAVGFAMLAAVGLYIEQAYRTTKAPPLLAHVVRQTHSGPRRVYFCATHTKDYTAFVECLRNV